MTDRDDSLQPAPARRAERGRWAPWWLYLIVLLGANYLRGLVLPGDALPLAATVSIAVGQAAVLFVIVTAVWRALGRGSGGRPGA